MYQEIDWREELGDTIDVRLRLNEPLSGHTSFRIGGPADVFAETGNMGQLRKLISFCRFRSIPLLIIGRGTNLLISDKGRRGVVAKLCGDFTQVRFGSMDTSGFQCVTTGAAVALPRLSRLTAEKGLAGLEFAKRTEEVA